MPSESRKRVSAAAKTMALLVEKKRSDRYSREQETEATCQSKSLSRDEAQCFVVARLASEFETRLAVPNTCSRLYVLDAEKEFVFAIRQRTNAQVGGTRFIAVSRTSGEVRDMGMVGE